MCRWLATGIGSEYSEHARLLVEPADEASVVEILTPYLNHPENDVVFWAGLRCDGTAIARLLQEEGSEERNFSSLVVRLPRSWTSVFNR